MDNSPPIQHQPLAHGPVDDDWLHRHDLIHQQLSQQSGPLLGSLVAATALAGAVTANGNRLAITTEDLTTAAGSDYTLTVTDSMVNAGSLIFVTRMGGTNTIEPVYLLPTVAGSGSFTVTLRNGGGGALDGNVVLGVVVF